MEQPDQVWIESRLRAIRTARVMIRASIEIVESVMNSQERFEGHPLTHLEWALVNLRYLEEDPSWPKQGELFPSSLTEE